MHMRQYIQLLFLAIAMMVCTTLQAQPPQDGKQRMSREQLAEKQAKHIADKLNLPDDATKKFVATFTDCQKEMWKIKPQGKPHKGEPTDAECQQAIKDRFAISEKILHIRQKYYKKYSSFLTQKQIQQVYDEEKKMMERFQHRHKKGDKQRPPQPR